MKRTALTLALIASWSAAGVASADTLYQEDFEAAGDSFSSHGWSGVISTTGGSLTSSTTDPARIDTSGGDLEGLRNARVGNSAGSDLWFWSDEPNIDMSAYTGLKMSIQHAENGDVETDDGYRLAVKVGSDWYLQDGLIAADSSGTPATDEIDLATDTFILWAGAPANDTTTWSEPGNGGVSLPSGTITAIGVMVLQTQGSEELRFDDVQITGTPTAVVPAPAAVSAGLVMMAFVAMRRRRG